MSTRKALRHFPTTHAATKPGRFGALRSVLAFFLASGLFVSSTVGFIYRDLQLQVADNSINISDFVVDKGENSANGHLPADAFEGRAINILIANIDSRYGQGSDDIGYSDEVSTIHSDSTMVAHISADRKRVQFVSIPRDLITDIPSCINANGVKTEPYEGMFNSAFATGAVTDNTAAGIACTQSTVEDLTGLTIDGFVLADFKGFQGMVDALGGVWFYLPERIDDDYATLYIDAGCHKFDGLTALRYSRARYSVGDGSDLSRIGRQQQIVAAMLRELFAKNFVTEFPSVLGFVKNSLNAVNTSPNLADFNADMGLLLSLSKIDRSGIQLTTMPNIPHPDDLNRVASKEPLATEIWRAFKLDRPFPIGTEYTDGNGQLVTVPDPFVIQETSPSTAEAGEDSDTVPSTDEDAAPNTAQGEEAAVEEAPQIPSCPPQ